MKTIATLKTTKNLPLDNIDVNHLEQDWVDNPPEHHDLYRRYLHHKTRHDRYKARFLAERKAKFWTAGVMTVVIMISVVAVYVTQSVPKRMAEDRYLDAQAIADSQRREMKDQDELVRSLRQQLVLARGDGTTEFSLFQTDLMVPQNDTFIKSILFQSSRDLRGKGVKIQMLVVNPTDEDFTPAFELNFYDFEGKLVHTYDTKNQRMSDNWIVPAGSSLTLEDRIYDVPMNDAVTFFGLVPRDASSGTQP